MATINHYISYKKSDNTYNVKYELIHNRQKRYFSSSIFLTESQIKKKKVKTKAGVEYSIRDIKVLEKVQDEEKAIRGKILDIGLSIKNMPIDELKSLITSVEAPKSVEFVSFCKAYLEELLINGKVGTHRAMKSPYNHLVDYVPSIDASDVDSGFIKSFEEFLRSERKIVRSNGQKSKHEIVSTLGDAGVFKVMQGIRNFHNKCKERFNTERNIIVTSDPFKYYKMPKYKLERKDMDKDLVEKIKNFKKSELSGRKEISRDIFMLSFYLCGMNAKDIYLGTYKIIDGRIEYERSKTSERRADNAFISVSIPDEAKPLLQKYNPEYLKNKYKSHEGLLKGLSMGFKDTGFSFYDARHAFASIAVNICGFSFDKVERALNHFDESRVINRYAARDWSIVDEVQAAVIEKVL